jgi:hypothetical protein
MVLDFLNTYISVPFVVSALLAPELLKALFPGFFTRLPNRWMLVVVLLTSLVMAAANILVWQLVHGPEGSYEMGEKIIVSWFCLSTFYSYGFKQVSQLTAQSVKAIIGRIQKTLTAKDNHEPV